MCIRRFGVATVRNEAAADTMRGVNRWTRWAAQLALFVVVSAGMSTADAADQVRTLKWAELVPPITAQKPRSLFPGAVPLSQLNPAAPDAPSIDDNAPPPPFREGSWMSAPSRQRPAGQPLIVAALDGQRVRIGGYVVALDIEATKITEFLLVPFVGTCIHVPPPPANQIVYVKTATPFQLKGQFAPVWVSGIIRADTAFTGLADAGYTMTDPTVETRAE